MRNRLLPLALLALAALAIGLWLATRGRERDSSSERPATHPPVASVGNAPTAELARAPSAQDSAVPAEVTAPASRSAASTEYESELQTGLWVEGRVAVPPET